MWFDHGVNCNIVSDKHRQEFSSCVLLLLFLWQNGNTGKRYNTYCLFICPILAYCSYGNEGKPESSIALQTCSDSAERRHRNDLILTDPFIINAKLTACQ